jgi:hypothetical protein
MSVFPLLNELKGKLKTNYTAIQLVSTIAKLQDDDLELVQALIFAYYLSSGGSIDCNKIKLPYHGLAGPQGKGVRYTLNKLPKELQDLIAAYVL